MGYRQKERFIILSSGRYGVFPQNDFGQSLLYGYNTLLSFPNSKPLKNRTSIVLAPEGVKRDDCTIVYSLDELKKELEKYDTNEVFVIGGAMFYRTMLPYCDEVLVTKVDADGGAEVFYENLDALDNWEMVYQSNEVETNGHKIRFTTYKNNKVVPF